MEIKDITPSSAYHVSKAHSVQVIKYMLIIPCIIINVQSSSRTE